MGAYSPGSFPAASSVVSPSYQKMTLAGNYIDFTAQATAGWAQQYLPELYEQEVDRYGNRTISGFLSMLSAEMPLQSDQVIWSEQGRLHLSYKGVLNTGTGVISATKNIDTNAAEDHAVRVGNTLVCQYIKSGSAGTGKVFKAIVVEESSANSLKIAPYGAANLNAALGLSGNETDGVLTFFVYGSEFDKGTDKMGGSIEPNFKTFTNRPIIIKDHFEINGSDTAQIGWIEVAGESGQGGYLWYLKSSGDTRVRFNDYMEMVMVEAEEKGAGVFTGGDNATDALIGGVQGTDGLFAAIEKRGIVATDMFDGDNAAGSLADFDTLLGELDKQGAIEENMLYLNRASNLDIDDFLGSLSAGTQGGTAYGVFENSEDMALNLGFTGFRRGSYDFYKTDWKYLNDPQTRGAFTAADGETIDGVLIPAGTSSVYDQQVGSNVRRPFLHVRYRAGAADDRKLKSWVTGSVGGPTSSNIDKMEINYLSERCLVVQAANNFVLFKQ